MSGEPIDDGGRAFPHSSQPLDAQGNPMCGEHSEWGMSYRGWLIGKAMQGFCANSDYAGMKHEVLASMARKQADAVIAEMKGGEG